MVKPQSTRDGPLARMVREEVIWEKKAWQGAGAQGAKKQKEWQWHEKGQERGQRVGCERKLGCDVWRWRWKGKEGW